MNVANNKTEVRNFYSVGVIPEWIYNHIVRKNISGELLLSNIVLDEKLSLDDIAVVLFLNREMMSTLFSRDSEINKLKLNITLTSYDLYDELSKIKLGCNNERLNARIDTAKSWSYSDRIEQDVFERLNSVCNEASPPYEFIVTGPKIWLVVKPGFLTMLKNPELRCVFYRDYLSTINDAASFEAVVRTDVFAHYVGEIVK